MVGLRKELVDDFLSRVGDAADTCRRVIAGEAAMLDCRREGFGEGDALFAAEDRLRRSRFCESRAVGSLAFCHTAGSPTLGSSISSKVSAMRDVDVAKHVYTKKEGFLE